ncbi:MAG: hypothetical protein NVS2B12_42050 [Ktedonobacteraceae bacterium]
MPANREVHIMPLPRDERDRILLMVEDGQVSAAQAGQLLDALEGEPAYSHPQGRARERTLRVRGTSLQQGQHKTNFTASISVQLVKLSLRLSKHVLPQLNTRVIEDILRSIESGATGRLLDLQDLEQGERIEVFVE